MRVVLALLVLLVLFMPALHAAASPSFPEDHEITVMSRNVYHGVDAEILSVPAATSYEDLLSRVADVYQGYQARNFPERADALAAEVARTQPTLIGLQEVVLVRTGQLLDPAPAKTVAFDYVQMLLNALSERNLHYAVVAESHGLDIEMPSSLGFDVRHTDREVILARTDLPPGHLQHSNVQTGHFSANCQIPSTLSGPITILRGWVSVDVWTRGRSFRFISTHLDGDCLPATSQVQVAQAQELLTSAALTNLPVLLVGDLNSSPLDPAPSAYSEMTDRGFHDAWREAGFGDGFTCCQADDLLNTASLLDRRIDYVLFRGDFEVVTLSRVGNDPVNRTVSGLWPSDHAGVVATLKIPKR